MVPMTLPEVPKLGRKKAEIRDGWLFTRGKAKGTVIGVMVNADMRVTNSGKCSYLPLGVGTRVALRGRGVSGFIVKVAGDMATATGMVTVDLEKPLIGNRRSVTYPREYWEIERFPAYFQKERGKGKAMTHFCKDGDRMGIVTEAAGPDEFIDEFVRVLADAIEHECYDGDWLFQLERWIPQAMEIFLKLKGYKTEIVVERRVLAAGYFGDPIDASVFHINSKHEVVYAPEPQVSVGTTGA